METKLGLHAIGHMYNNQKNEAYDVGSVTSSFDLPKARPSRHTRLRLARMALVRSKKITLVREYIKLSCKGRWLNDGYFAYRAACHSLCLNFFVL